MPHVELTWHLTGPTLNSVLLNSGRSFGARVEVLIVAGHLSTRGIPRRLGKSLQEGRGAGKRQLPVFHRACQRVSGSDLTTPATRFPRKSPTTESRVSPKDNSCVPGVTRRPPSVASTKPRPTRVAGVTRWTRWPLSSMCRRCSSSTVISQQRGRGSSIASDSNPPRWRCLESTGSWGMISCAIP